MFAREQGIISVGYNTAGTAGVVVPVSTSGTVGTLKTVTGTSILDGIACTSTTACDVASDAAVAVQAAGTPPGCIATLILPADTAWSEGAAAAQPLKAPMPAPGTYLVAAPQ